VGGAADIAAVAVERAGVGCGAGVGGVVLAGLVVRMFAEIKSAPFKLTADWRWSARICVYPRL